MSPITGPEISHDFSSTLPLSNTANAAIDRAFEMGWLDPSKLHHDSAKLRNLIEESRESIATNLGLEKTSLEFVGELGFGYWTAISGALKNSKKTFIHGATDRQVVHAFAREHQSAGNKVVTLTCGRDGLFDYQQSVDGSWVFWQATNRETGIEQEAPSSESVNVIADLTASFDPKRLPRKWDVALWDPRNFSGPEGLAIIAINSESAWRSPIPPIDKRRVFGSFSKPLLLLTAIALEDWVKDQIAKRRKIADLNKRLRKHLSEEIRDVSIVGETSNTDPRYLAIVLKGLVAEELLRGLDAKGIKVDAGSACGAGALSPSHVLEAMGFGQDGQIRITIKTAHDEGDIDKLVKALADQVGELRND